MWGYARHPVTPLILCLCFPAEVDGEDPHERPLTAVADQPMVLAGNQQARLNRPTVYSSAVNNSSRIRLEEGKAKRDLWRTAKMRKARVSLSDWQVLDELLTADLLVAI